MPQEMVQEAVEIVTMSVDKFINVKNYEVGRSSWFSLGVMSALASMDALNADRTRSTVKK